MCRQKRGQLAQGAQCLRSVLVGGPLGLSILACCIRWVHALSGGQWDVMMVTSVWQGAHVPGTGLAVPAFSSQHVRGVSGKASES